MDEITIFPPSFWEGHGIVEAACQVPGAARIDFSSIRGARGAVSVITCMRARTLQCRPPSASPLSRARPLMTGRPVESVPRFGRKARLGPNRCSVAGLLFVVARKARA